MNRRNKKDIIDLPLALKVGIENLSGQSLGDVKVHFNSSQPAISQANNYTQGEVINLVPGQEQHLPHEAWHVAQQKQGRVKPTVQLKSQVNISDDDTLEKAADEMGENAVKLKGFGADSMKNQTINTKNIPFQTIDWANIDKTIYEGEPGVAYWQTLQFPGLRLRLVEYSADYFANHWCTKGHIVHCLEGEFISELQNGERFTLTAGMSYIVSDELSSHRSISKNGVKVLIIDGDFLMLKDN